MARRFERTRSPRRNSRVTFAIARVLSANVRVSTWVNARPEESAAIWASCRDFVGWRDPAGLLWTALRSLVMKGSAVRIRASAFLRTRIGAGSTAVVVGYARPNTQDKPNDPIPSRRGNFSNPEARNFHRPLLEHRDSVL